ncbi:HAD family hydrolase [Periweissella cryptocerci]|uniref:HAD family hydrolase n=1 Tax=Periweissella cryptocerci TaxID=2506420 RepID=A0A4P6YU41_9LACO|nr:HAD hydrolase-like protein [Periweissella cryptocerci]QBO36221.1 HAD family hydrolase [Periweissella cryptocerci]
MINQYDYIFFDMDGTITDSAEGILNSLDYAIEKLGLEHRSRVEMQTFIGPPMLDSFERIWGLDEAAARHAVDVYREYFGEKGKFENAIYPDIEYTLSLLKMYGKHLYIASSKAEVFVREIIEHFALANYFDGVYGATLDGSRAAKTEVLAYAIAQSGLVDKSKALMIGDTDNDIIGGRENGLDTLGVNYGIGAKAELEAAGATYIVDTPKAILDIE